MQDNTQTKTQKIGKELARQIQIVKPGTIAQLIDETRSFVGDKFEVCVSPFFYMGHLQGYKVVLYWREAGKVKKLSVPRGSAYSVFK